MIQMALISIALIGIGLLFMCIQILFKRGGRFHAQHIGQSKAMRERGIHCVQSMDEMERQQKAKIKHNKQS